MRLRSAVLAGVALAALGVLPAWGSSGNPALDDTFSGDGVATLDIARRGEWFWQVVAADDGRVYMLGDSWTKTSDQGLVAAYDGRGRLDRTFSGDGLFRKAVAGKTWFGDGVALPDGKLLVVGQTKDWRRVLVARLRHDGRVDRSFADGLGHLPDGFRLLPQPDRSGWYVRVAMDSAGNAYVASDNVAGAKPYRTSIVVTKLSPAGAVVRSFGDQGQVSLRPARAQAVTGLAVDSQDRPIVLASILDRRADPTSTATLFRLTPTGQPDVTLNGSGRTDLRLPSGAAIWPMSVDVTSTDDVVVGSKTSSSVRNSQFAVHRVLSSGELDPSYSGDGVAFVRTGLHLGGYPGGGRLLPDGSYLFTTGLFSKDGRGFMKSVLLRITPAGVLDPTFGRDGLFIPNMVKGGEALLQAAVDAEGRVVLNGGASAAALAARITVTN